jgi:hemolysin III
LLPIKHYSQKEEKINIISHQIGILASLIGFVLIFIKSYSGGLTYIISAVIFSSSMLILYTASVLYHSCTEDNKRYKLKIFDHSAIFIFIAGSYTPFTLIILPTFAGWILFFIIWSIATTGVVLKLFFTGRYNTLSTVIYIIMGWLVIFFISAVIDNLATAGLVWLVAGGIFYTIGAVNYLFKTIEYTHATFHIFVLIGSLCHYICIYNYVLI